MPSFSLQNKHTEYALGAEGSRGEASQIALSHDGKIAYGSGQNLIVSDINNLAQPLHVDLAFKKVRSVGFAHDGLQLAYGTNDDIKTLDTTTWNQISYYQNEAQDGVTMVQYSRDGKHLISASQNSERAMKCRLVSSGKVLEAMPCNQGKYYGGIVSANNQIVGFSQKNNNLFTFKFAPLAYLTREELSHFAMCGTFIGNTSKFVVPNGLNAIKLYNFKDIEEIASYTSPKQSRVYGFCQPTQDSHLVLSIHGSEKNMRLWDIEKGQVLYTKNIHENSRKVGDMPTSCVWYQNQILISSVDGGFKKFDARNVENIDSVQFNEIEQHHYTRSATSSILPLHDSSSFIINDSTGNMGRWNLNADNPSESNSFDSFLQYKGDDLNVVHRACFFDQNHILQFRAKFIELVTKDGSGNIFKSQKVSDIVSQSACNIDEKNILAVEAKTQKIYHFNIDSITEAKEILDLKLKNNVSIKYCKKAELLAAFSGKTLRFYRVKKNPVSLELVNDNKTVTENINDVSWSPDGSYLAVSEADGIRIIKCNEDFTRAVGLLNPMLGKPSCIAWTPKEGDDKIAIGYYDGSISICKAVNKSGIVPLKLEKDHYNRIITHIHWLNENLLCAASNNLFRTYNISE